MSDGNTNAPADLPMTPVSSSNVRAIGTEGNDLLVQYQSGDTYRFVGGAGHAGAIISSGSPGGYIFRHLGRSGVRE